MKYLERFLDFLEILEITEILEILEMGFTKEWFFKPYQIAIDRYMGIGRMWSSVGQNKATYVVIHNWHKFRIKRYR